MKPAVLLVLAAALGLAGGAAAAALLSPRAAAAGDDVAVRVAALSSRLDDVAATLSRHDETLQIVQQRLSERSAGAALPLAEIDRAVERALATRAAQAAPAAGDVAPPPAAAGAPPPSAADLFDRLTDADLPDREREQLWQRAREAGLTDELVALFEKLAEGRPHDADLKVALGVAYLEKIQEVGNGPQAGVWATKADKAFDAALQLDPQNWSARFTKAIALSFWPPIFGKQSEAVKQFETLLEQQRGQPTQPRFAQTYLLLGNLYSQMGQADKAASVWQQGSQLFPDDEALAAQSGG